MADLKVNYLVNLKSGLCPENCNYCSQAIGSDAPILKYSYLSKTEALNQAGAGLRGGASRVCMVSSGRGSSNRDVDKVVEITESLKDQHAGVAACDCLGLLKEGQAQRLKQAGVTPTTTTSARPNPTTTASCKLTPTLTGSTPSVRRSLLDSHRARA